MPVEQLAEEAKQFGRSGTAYGSVAEALYAAREAAQLQGALTVVLGSVFTVGEALTALNQPVD
jgi:folylpolyglutamate synthase/dihydropteroate synthase